MDSLPSAKKVVIVSRVENEFENLMKFLKGQILSRCTLFSKSRRSIEQTDYRAIGRSENLGVPVLFGGHNLPPLVEIWLTDLIKYGGAMAPWHS
jgi:hypothetical protein